MSKTINKFGKPSVDIAGIKDFLIDENDELIKGDRQINEVYISQKKRKSCKNCDSKIEGIDFYKQNIPYSICSVCGHLNGLFEDSDEFCEIAYQGSGKDDYKKNYMETDFEKFNKRVKSVYQPKVKFLIDSLKKDKKTQELNSSFCDIGAGLGYFIKALTLEGQSNVKGFEVSKENVNLANEILKNNSVEYYEIKDTLKTIKSINSEVVSMIGVLEHLQDPISILKTIKENKFIKYIYLSVPIFGPSVFFEILSPNTFHRQLSRDHTHLYTNESLEWLCKNTGFDRVSEWWFGQDMMDLYRHILVHAKKNNELSVKASDLFKSMLSPIIDSLQLTIDKQKLSNEIHLLLKKN